MCDSLAFRGINTCDMDPVFALFMLIFIISAGFCLWGLAYWLGIPFFSRQGPIHGDDEEDLGSGY